MSIINKYSNVVDAMGIRPHPFLGHVKALLSADPRKLIASIDLLPGNNSSSSTEMYLLLR